MRSWTGKGLKRDGLSSELLWVFLLHFSLSFSTMQQTTGQTRQPSRQFSLPSAVLVLPRAVGSGDGGRLSAGDGGEADGAALLM